MGRIDEFGRYRERDARASAAWVVILLAVVALVCLLLAACAEPAQPEWRVVVDSLYEQAQQGRLAAQDTSWQREYARRLAVMNTWQSNKR